MYPHTAEKSLSRFSELPLHARALDVYEGVVDFLVAEEVFNVDYVFCVVVLHGGPSML